MAGPMSSEQATALQEDSRKIEGILAELSEEDQELWGLRIGEDLPYEKVAELLGKTPEACRKAMSRLINRIKEKLRQAGVELERPKNENKRRE